MVKGRIILVKVVIVILLFSCSQKWLDVKSDKALAVPIKATELQLLLDNSSVLNVVSTVMQGEIAADGHYYSDNDWNQYAGSVYQNAYTWTNDIIGYINDWNAPYNAILTLNVVLNGAEKLKSDPDANGIIGQALFQRSRLYFDLVQTFSPVYEKSTARNTLSIPLRLTTDITEPSTRSTLFNVYKQITNDLKLAALLLPGEAKYLTRASKASALALLSRVYLSMQIYDSAFNYSDRCIALKEEILDYNTVPSEKGFIGLNKEILFFDYFIPLPLITSDYLIDLSLYNLYDENDLRKQLFFLINGDRIQFKGTYGNSATDIFAGIALDEVYLTRSECYARLDQLALAMKDLNTLLESRWRKENGTSTFIDKVANTKAEALKIILAERRKQLILRNVRWMDLRRLNLEPETAVEINRTLKEVNYVLKPKSYQYTFPIPNDIIQKTGISQNAGWQ